MHIGYACFYFIFVHFWLFPVFDFVLIHSTSQPFICTSLIVRYTHSIHVVYNVPGTRGLSRNWRLRLWSGRLWPWHSSHWFLTKLGITVTSLTIWYTCTRTLLDKWPLGFSRSLCLLSASYIRCSLYRSWTNLCTDVHTPWKLHWGRRISNS